MEGFMTLVVVLFLLNQLLHVRGSVEVSMNFISYNNPSWKDWHGNRCDVLDSCDPFFHICVDKYDGNDNMRAAGDCEYLFTETGVYHETNNINFNHDMHGLQNPIIFNIPSFDTGFLLKVTVWEQDEGFIRRNERVDYIVHKFTVKPGKGRSAPGQLMRTVVPGIRQNEPSTLTLNVMAYCAENHVSNWETCDSFCEPQDSKRYGHYSCSDSGDKICLKGWENPFRECKISIDDCPKDHSCKNGGECQDGHLTYTCKCPKHLSGPVCTEGKDPCLNKPCSSGMFCVSGVGGGYECSLIKIGLQQQVATTQEGVPPYVIGLIAGIVLIILVVVILIAVIWMKRKKRRKDRGSDAYGESSHRSQQTSDHRNPYHHREPNHHHDSRHHRDPHHHSDQHAYVSRSSGHMNPGFSNNPHDAVYENNMNGAFAESSTGSQTPYPNMVSTSSNTPYGAKAFEAGIVTPPPYREWEQPRGKHDQDFSPERPPPRGSTSRPSRQDTRGIGRVLNNSQSRNGNDRHFGREGSVDMEY